MYEDLGKTILSHTEKLDQVRSLILRRAHNMHSLNFSRTSALELRELFDAFPGGLDNLHTLDLSHIPFDQKIDDLLYAIHAKCPHLKDLRLPEKK